MKARLPVALVALSLSALAGCGVDAASTSLTDGTSGGAPYTAWDGEATSPGRSSDVGVAGTSGVTGSYADPARSPGNADNPYGLRFRGGWWKDH
jgi:hypothetical protein